MIRWFREHDVKTVYGNHDEEMIQLYDACNGNVSDVPPEAYCWAHHNCNLLTREDIEYLKSLPKTLDFEADGFYYRITHMYIGRERPQSVCQYDNFINEMPPERQDLPLRLVLGHSHRQAICQLRGERLWMNPGSVSYRRPDDPDKTAHYAVIQDGEISLRAVEYCRTPLLQATLDLALAQTLREDQLRVGFFFFGSAPTTRIPVEESIRQAQQELNKA